MIDQSNIQVSDNLEIANVSEETLAEVLSIGDIKIEGEKPDNIPTKFWDDQQGAIRIDALIESYRHLERKLSASMPQPSNEEDKIRILKMLGMPDTADAYDVDVSHGLFDVDMDINDKMFQQGFTVDQVQAVYDLAAEKFVPLVLEIAHEFQADREVERLVAAFGGTDKWQEVSRQLLAYGQQNLPEQVLQSLSGSFEGVMALYRMMKGDEPELMRGLENGLGAMAGGEDDLKSMMRDPRYWRDKDPSHVAKVTQGFERLYSEK